jgi:transcriptional regulator of arginine metabolism
MKVARHKKILELIKSYEITTQEELAERLIDCGFIVTQATVSRDIRELNLTKMSVGGKIQKYIAVPTTETRMNDKLLKILKAGYISGDVAGNLLVIKTASGMAMAVAAALDALNYHEIVGCIAGDDTIFCAIRESADTFKILEKLVKIVNK